jgi:hypothetical protein
MGYTVRRRRRRRVSSVLNLERFGGYHGNQGEEPHWFWPDRCVLSGLIW